MPSLAEKRLVAVSEDTDTAGRRRRRVPRRCVSSKRCCSRPPIRSTRRRSPSVCRTASTCKLALRDLQADYAARGVNLVHLGDKWTFRTAADLSWLMTREVVETRKLSRAAIETLAIIAYHQPVTRTEIEEIRGVATSRGTLDVLLETDVDPAARPPQDAGPAADLRHHRSVPVAIRRRVARRPAGPRGAQGNGPARLAPAVRLHGADAVRRSGAARGRGPAGAGRSRPGAGAAAEPEKE